MQIKRTQKKCDTNISERMRQLGMKSSEEEEKTEDLDGTNNVILCAPCSMDMLQYKRRQITRGHKSFRSSTHSCMNATYALG